MKQDMTIAAVQDYINSTANQIMALINQLETDTGCKVWGVDMERVEWLSGVFQVVKVNLDVRV